MKSLFIKQKFLKITDHYPINDETGKTIYKVDQDFNLIGNTVHVSTPNGQRLFTVNRKVVSFMPKFIVEFANGQTMDIKSNFSLFRQNIDIISKSYFLTLEGDFLGRKYTISHRGQFVGKITRKLLTFRDTYRLDILDETLQDVIVAVAIAVDRIIDEAKR